jgi:hypothetical protein
MGGLKHSRLGDDVQDLPAKQRAFKVVLAKPFAHQLEPHFGNGGKAARFRQLESALDRGNTTIHSAKHETGWDGRQRSPSLREC